MPYFVKLSDFIDVSTNSFNPYNQNSLILRVVWNFTSICQERYGDIGVSMLLCNIPGLQLHPNQDWKTYEYYTPSTIPPQYLISMSDNANSIKKADTNSDSNGPLLSHTGFGKLVNIITNFYMISTRYNFYDDAYIHVTCNEPRKIQSIIENGLYGEGALDPDLRVGDYDPERDGRGPERDGMGEELGEIDWSYLDQNYGMGFNRKRKYTNKWTRAKNTKRKRRSTLNRRVRKHN